MIGKPELILRPSTRYPSRPWALQLRVAGPAETSYAPVGHVSDNVARILADEGYASFLFGDPREDGSMQEGERL